MPSVETLVSEALARLEPVAYEAVEADKRGWLTVRWCYETGRVNMGCRFCARSLEQGKIQMPHRYRDKTKSCSFAHGNVWQELQRAVSFHSTTKIHLRALELRDSAESIEANPSRVDGDWKNAAYLCFKSIIKLKPAAHFVESCNNAIRVGGMLSRVAYRTERFYDEMLQVFQGQELRCLMMDMKRRAFPWVVVSSNAGKRFRRKDLLYCLSWREIFDRDALH